MSIQHCVYRFLNESGEPIYIGRTDRLDQRMYEHFIEHERIGEHYAEVKNVEYTVVNTSADERILEDLLIRTVHPKYNGTGNTFPNDAITFQLKIGDLEWVPYNIKALKTRNRASKKHRIYHRTIKKKTINKEFNAEECFNKVLNTFNKANLIPDIIDTRCKYLTNYIDDIGDFVNKTDMRKYKKEEISRFIVNGLDTYYSGQLQALSFLAKNFENLEQKEFLAFYIDILLEELDRSGWMKYLEGITKPQVNWTILSNNLFEIRKYTTSICRFTKSYAKNFWIFGNKFNVVPPNVTYITEEELLTEGVKNIISYINSHIFFRISCKED